MRFFKQVPTNASIKWDENGLRGEMEEPDDESIRAAVTAFRQIYNPQEPTSVKRVMDVLSQSAHEHNGPRRDETIMAVRELRKCTRDAVSRGIGMGIVFDSGTSQRSVDPAAIVDAYFHGRYLHSGNELADEVRRLDDIGPWARFTLYHVMFESTRSYCVVANIVDRILEVPELLDCDARPHAESPPGRASTGSPSS